LCKKITPFLWLAWPDKEPIPDEFSAKFKGYLRVPESGEYRLVVSADDGARLNLDGSVLAESLVPDQPNDLSTTIVLTQGDHPIEIDYFQTGGGSALEFQWQPPNQALTIVPPDALLPEKP
jgi:hypothetical protein